MVRLTDRLDLTIVVDWDVQPQIKQNYRNDPKFSDRYAWANSADPDQTAPRDHGLHCLPFRLHRLDSLLYGRAT